MEHRPVSLDPPERSTLEVALRRTAKRAVRGLAMSTARWRVDPDFLIIGAKRGGTTTLWKALQGHPDVLPLVPAIERTKGTYFFDENFTSRSLRWYRSHYPLAPVVALRRRLRQRPVTGEASPYYLYHPHAPARVAATCNGALRIAILRDPVERAFSHWKERVANGTEPLSFEDALRAEPERLAHERERLEASPGYVSPVHRHQSYIDQGRYAGSLRRWIEKSPPGAVEVLISEEVFPDWERALGRLHSRLGLRAVASPVDAAYNAQRSRPMSDEARRLLEHELVDDVRDLRRLLGRPLPWSIDV